MAAEKCEQQRADLCANIYRQCHIIAFSDAHYAPARRYDDADMALPPRTQRADARTPA
jgi:hypothetical protein